MRFIDLLGKELERRGLSKRELARLMGVPEGTVYSWFSSRANEPAVEYAAAAARALGVPLDRLTGAPADPELLSGLADLDFWDRLDEVIRIRGTTRKAVAELAGFNVGNFGAWKSRRDIPRGDVLVAIAAVLRVPAEFLISGRRVQPAAGELTGSNLWASGNPELMEILMELEEREGKRGLEELALYARFRLASNS